MPIQYTTDTFRSQNSKDFEPSPKDARTESDGDDTSNEEIGNGDDDDDAARALDPNRAKGGHKHATPSM